MKRNVFFTVLVIFYFSALEAQDQVSEKLKVFVDCNIETCDENFVKTEISVIDFVIDRVAADVHILITSRENGSGGLSIQLIFFGQNEFKGIYDTLFCNLSATATPFEKRIQIVKKIKLGLIEFISNSSTADLIEINMKPVNRNADNAKTAKAEDKWNYWVFKIGGDGTFNADQVYKSTQVSGTISANRTTDKIKIGFSIYGSLNKYSYEYDNYGILSKYKIKNSDKQLNHYLVKSISNHWSMGYQATYSNSTFSNNRSRKYLRGLIEYSFFPYKEVNNKLFTINYGVDIRDNKYYDTTIYNKMEEVLLGHKLQANLSLKQKWGYINSSISYFNYLKERQLNNVALTVNIGIRITGGLSFYLYSNAALVHDQLYLVKGNATEQEILTKRRQLASAYNFYSGAGLNFRFGSILNNFVNPRLENF